MKKTLIPLLALSFLVATPTFTHAEEGGLRVRVQSMKAEVKGNVEVRKASSTDRMMASSTRKNMMIHQDVAKRMVGHVKALLTATAERLQKIADRVESRIAKVKAEGGVTTDSERFLTEARMHLTEARTAISAFGSISLTSDSMSENVAKLRELAADAKEHLGEARHSLSEAISALKPGRTEVKVRATSTATTTHQ